LKGNSTYQFRLVSSNQYGTTTGKVSTFTTCDKTEVTWGNVEALGCFAASVGGSYKSTGTVRINGVDFDPATGGTITIDPSGSALSASGNGVIRIGGVLPVPWLTALHVDLRNTFTLPNVDSDLHGFHVKGSLKGEILPEGEMQFVGQADMNIVGDPIRATVGIITSNRTGLAGAEVGVGRSDAAPADIHTILGCIPGEPPSREGFKCVQTKTKKGDSVGRLAPAGPLTNVADQHLMPFCGSGTRVPVGYKCVQVATADGKGRRGRLLPRNPGIVRLARFLAVENLAFSYDAASSEWGGEATVTLGDMLPGALGKALADKRLTVGLKIGVNPVQLNEVKAGFSGFSIPIGPASLESADFDLGLHPRFFIKGDADLIAGPSRTVEISGGFDYRTGTSSGFDLRLHGAVSVKTITIDGYVEYDGTNGSNKVLLGGSFTRSWGPVDVTLGVGGGIEINPFHFQLTGDGRIGAFGANVQAHGIVSDAGVGACGAIDVLLFHGEVGFRHFWSGQTDFLGCDFSGLYTVGAPNASAIRTGRSVRLRPGLAGEEFAAVGAHAPPDVVLTGPHGERVETPTEPDKIKMTGRVLALAVSDTRTTYFIVERPSGGRWRIAPTSGPAPVRYKRADPIEAPAIHARVTGRGQSRVLRWRLNAQRGQTVRFVQTGGRSPTIATTTKASGHASFKIASGPSGVRHVTAIVSIDGLPRLTRRVASFRATRPTPPAVRRATYRTSQKTLTVSWKRLRGGDHYDVEVRSASGLRRYRATGSASSLALRLTTGDRVRRVTVRATARGIVGPPVTARRSR
jgi:hypothetical protein